MALTQTDVDNLETALVTGELSVEIEGKKVTYRSVTEIKDALAYAKNEIEKTAAGGQTNQSYAGFSRD